MNTNPPDDLQRRLVELRYQFWTRLYEAADELMSIADDWYENDPAMLELHLHRCGYSDEFATERDLKRLEEKLYLEMSAGPKRKNSSQSSERSR